MEKTSIVNYVNFEMDEVNNLSSDLYEAMIDNENEAVISVTEAMIDKLKDIQKSYK